jgi:hypothetical protein
MELRACEGGSSVGIIVAQSPGKRQSGAEIKPAKSAIHKAKAPHKAALLHRNQE